MVKDGVWSDEEPEQMEESGDDQPVQVGVSQKGTTVDDLTQMASQLKIGKRRRIDSDEDMLKVSAKSKGIGKKKPQCKRLKKQLGFN